MSEQGRSGPGAGQERASNKARAGQMQDESREDAGADAGAEESREKYITNRPTDLSRDISLDVGFVLEMAVQSLKTGSRVDVAEFHFRS